MSAPARILSIAGSDSSGGAGIQADIKTITMLGGYAMTAITAITAQNTAGVQAVEVLSPQMVTAQVKCCIDDIGVDAVKIGMLGSPGIAHAVADLLESVAAPIVFDPVMVATSGSVLADADTIAAFERLMAMAWMSTPNLPELEALGGEELVASKTGHLLIKGGHGEGDVIEDRLRTSQGTFTFESPRIETRHTHGTGCSLASAIATGAGQGLCAKVATDRAIRFVAEAIRSAPGFGHAAGPIGHTLNRVGFYDALAAGDDAGFAAGDFAAKWGG